LSKVLKRRSNGFLLIISKLKACHAVEHLVINSMRL
jgi:hypothetical protein